MKVKAALVMAAAVLLGATPARARVVEKIAAVVGDQVILQSEVEERAAPFMGEISAITNTQQRAARATALRREMLDRLIDEQLIFDQAAELKLTVSSEEIDRAVELIKKQNNLTDAQLQGELRKMGQTMSAYRQEMKKAIMRQRVIQIAVGSKASVSDKDLQEYYERNMKPGANVQVRASTIFISIPENADSATVRDKETHARKLLERAAAGEDFAKLAREFSQDPATREGGGDLDYFGKGILPKPIEEIVFSMRVGEVRGPVRADRGFHVIKLVDRKVQDAKPLTEIKDQLREQLQQKEVERLTKGYLTDLRKRTLVEIRL